MTNMQKHVTFPKGIRWELESRGDGCRGTWRYKTVRKDEKGKVVSFAVVTTRPKGLTCTFLSEVTLVGANGIATTTLERQFEGRNTQYSARKWAEIMLFFPPRMVATYTEI